MLRRNESFSKAAQTMVNRIRLRVCFREKGGFQISTFTVKAS
jgi:hypothetical protein